MRAGLGNDTVLEHVDAVGVLNCTESMGDRNRRAVLGCLVERALHDLLRLGVESGSGSVRGAAVRIAEPVGPNWVYLLVQQEDLRVADESPRDGNTFCRRHLSAAGAQAMTDELYPRRAWRSDGRRGLSRALRPLRVQGSDHTRLTLLTAGKRSTLAADLGVVRVGEAHDKVVDVGLLRGRLDLLLRDLLGRDEGAEGNVEADRAGVQRRLLLDEGNSLSIRLDVQRRDVLPVDDHASRDRVTAQDCDGSACWSPLP